MYLLTVTVPGRDTPPEVVPAEVHEHHVLGALLRVALELLGEDRVLGGRGATGARAGDRVRGELVAVELDEELRRGADDLERGNAHEEQVRARVDAAKAPVQPDPVERLAGRRIGRQVEGLAPGQHDLDRLAGRDRVLGDLDGVDVLRRARGLRRRRPGLPRRPSRSGSRRSPAPCISAADGRAVRSSASKIASSAIR